MEFFLIGTESRQFVQKFWSAPSPSSKIAGAEIDAEEINFCSIFIVLSLLCL
jgi:hypothetical protein